MENLNELELTKINGGLSGTVWGFIAVGVVFIASIIYGYIHPNKCEG